MVGEKVDWRRVSSTHSLEDLVGLTAPRTRSRVAATAVGLVLVASGLGFGLVSIVSLLSARPGCTREDAERGRLQFDGYYPLLLPLTVPTAIIFVILHWMSMKFFKHAYS